MLAESVLLAGAGTLSGLVLAGWASRAIVAQMSSPAAPLVLDLPTDWRVLGFTAAVMIVAVLIFGTAPALRAAGAAPIDALKEHARRAGRHAGCGHHTGLARRVRNRDPRRARLRRSRHGRFAAGDAGQRSSGSPDVSRRASRRHAASADVSLRRVRRHSDRREDRRRHR